MGILDAPSYSKAQTDAAIITGTQAEVQRTRSIRAVSLTADPSTLREYPRVRKAGSGPLMTWAQQSATGLYWPCLINLAQAGGSGFGLLWSTDHESTHSNSGVFMATLTSILNGTMTQRGRIYRDDVSGSQCETPSVIFDEDARPSVGTGLAISASGVITRTAHRLWIGRQVDVSAVTGATGLTAGTYYVVAVTTNTFTLSASAGGTPVAVTTSGTATVTAYGLWRMLYQMAGVSGAIGSQSTLQANCEDLATNPAAPAFTRQGIVLDKITNTPGDGHCGYAGYLAIGSQRRVISLYGGTTGGSNAVWTSGDWTSYQLAGQIGRSTQSIDHLPTFASDWIMRWTQAMYLNWRGEVWAIVPVGAVGAGPDVSIEFRIVAVRMRPDLQGPAGRAIDITPALSSWETSGIDGLGKGVSDNGTLYIPYRTGGKTGAFGLLEVY